MPARLSDAAELGRESLDQINRFLDGTGDVVAALGLDLLARHGYVIGTQGEGPHDNVLGQPLFALPLWVDTATGERGRAEPDVLLDVCESSLCGYLSVRAEDDYFDEGSGEPEAVMMLTTLFRIRHSALLAPLVSDARFWSHFEALWQAYGEAMLFEHSLHSDPTRSYDERDFDAVLVRSQPLEIPGQAVLAIKESWHLSDNLAAMVRHLVKGTQLFDDLTDARADLRSGNYTLMVRRLGGLDGDEALSRGMLIACDEVVSESAAELDKAVAAAGPLVCDEFLSWVEDRKRIMGRAPVRMKEAFFASVTAESAS